MQNINMIFVLSYKYPFISVWLENTYMSRSKT